VTSKKRLIWIKFKRSLIMIWEMEMKTRRKKEHLQNRNRIKRKRRNQRKVEVKMLRNQVIKKKQINPNHEYNKLD